MRFIIHSICQTPQLFIYQHVVQTNAEFCDTKGIGERTVEKDEVPGEEEEDAGGAVAQSVAEQVPTPEPVQTLWPAFLQSIGLAELSNASSNAYSLQFLATGTPAGFIHYMGDIGLQNQKATCVNPAHGNCVCWVQKRGTEHGGNAVDMLRELSRWLSLGGGSASAHAWESYAIKASFGMKP
jgi:hypothetical protein